MLEISRIEMESKNQVKDFNQRFTTLLNMICVSSRPTIKVLIEFYTSSIIVTIIVCVNMRSRPTIVETFSKVVKFEKQMISLIKGDIEIEEKKESTLMNKVSNRTKHNESKNKEPIDIDSLY